MPEHKQLAGQDSQEIFTLDNKHVTGQDSQEIFTLEHKPVHCLRLA